jgi:hypothetical protein
MVRGILTDDVYAIWGLLNELCLPLMCMDLFAPVTAPAKGLAGFKGGGMSQCGDITNGSSMTEYNYLSIYLCCQVILYRQYPISFGIDSSFLFLPSCKTAGDRIRTWDLFTVGRPATEGPGIGSLWVEFG